MNDMEGFKSPQEKHELEIFYTEDEIKLLKEAERHLMVHSFKGKASWGAIKGAFKILVSGMRKMPREKMGIDKPETLFEYFKRQEEGD